MQFPVAQAVMNDGSRCFKALLHLAVHLVSAARFSPGPSVFLLWLTAGKNSNRVGRWLTVGEMTVSRCFLQVHASHIPGFNISDHRVFHTPFPVFIMYVCSCGCSTLFACKSDLSHLGLIWCSELALWQLQYKQEHLMRIACFQHVCAAAAVGMCEACYSSSFRGSKRIKCRN